MSEGFRLTLELDEETRARWQLAADGIGYPRLDTWARDTLNAASDADVGEVAAPKRPTPEEET